MNRQELEAEMWKFPLGSPEQAELLAQWEEAKKRTGGVCLCGHSMKAHIAGTCAPGRMQCLCKHQREVIKTSNLRVFMKKTEGASAFHALSRGIMAALSKGATVEWVVDQKCDRCGSTERVVPAPIDTYKGKVTDESTELDSLICHKCYLEIGSVGGLS